MGQIKKEANNKKANVENLRTKYSSNENYNAIKKHINKFEKGGWFAPKTKEEVETQISKNRELALEKRENKNNNNNNIKPKLTKSIPVNNNAANAVKRKNVQNLRNKYSSNENYNAIKTHINKFEKGGWFAPKTRQAVENKISKNRELAFEKRQKEAENKERKKKENNEWKNKPTRPTLSRSGPLNVKAANNKVNSVKRIELANKVKKYIKNNNVKTLITNTIVTKILAGAITNYNKAILEVNKEIKKKQPSNNKVNGETNLLAKFNKTGQHERLKLFKKQAEVNKTKKEAEEALAIAAEKKKKREEANRKAKEAANKKAAANFEKAEKEEANRKAKEAANKKAKEEANRKAKEENLKRKQVQSKLINAMKNKPPPPPKNKKANLKKLVNNTMKGRAAKNVSRLKKNINEGVSEMAVKTRLAQLNKRTKYQLK